LGTGGKVEPSESVDVIPEKLADNEILACALATEADYLVTGDKKHLLPLKSFRRISIISPNEFFNAL